MKKPDIRLSKCLKTRCNRTSIYAKEPYSKRKLYKKPETMSLAKEKNNSVSPNKGKYWFSKRIKSMLTT